MRRRQREGHSAASLICCTSSPCSPSAPSSYRSRRPMGAARTRGTRCRTGLHTQHRTVRDVLLRSHSPIHRSACSSPTRGRRSCSSTLAFRIASSERLPPTVQSRPPTQTHTRHFRFLPRPTSRAVRRLWRSAPISSSGGHITSPPRRLAMSIPISTAASVRTLSPPPCARDTRA